MTTDLRPIKNVQIEKRFDEHYATMGYILLATIAAIGFVASLVCHLLGWLHVDPPFGKSVFVLHIGFLVLWFPLISLANRNMPKRTNNNLEYLLAELPSGARPILMFLFVYAILNFAYFMYSTSQYSKNNVPFYVELRGFSGHWMFFYGAAALGFAGLARLARKKKRVENVH